MWWVNGEATDLIAVADRGLAYGDGLFETMRVIENRIPLVELHMQRLTSGAERLKLPLVFSEVEKAIEQAIKWSEKNNYKQSIIKLILTRPGASAGYRFDMTQSSAKGDKATAGKPDAANILLRVSEFNPSKESTTLRVKVCKYVLGAQPMLAGIKHLNRLDQVMASQELGDGEDEGVLLDNRGFLAEGISNNLFIVQGSEVFTPKMEHCGVKGVMRDFLLQHLQSLLDISVYERDITLSELKSADEVLFTNAIRGVRNVRSISDLWESQSTKMGDRLRLLLSDKLGSGFTSC